jgi:tetratricopeptide (TPR) repeat protein
MKVDNVHQKQDVARYYPAGVCIFLTAVVLALYWQVQYYDFVDYDDNIYILENAHVQLGLSRQSFIWAFTTTHTAANWHPLTWLSFLFDYELYRFNPAGYHWTNIFFHAANTLLLFFIFLRTTGEIWKSAFVSVLFAIHPINVESVAWIAERKNVVSTFFGLLTILAYVFYVEVPGIKRYALVLLSFAMSLMAKPMLVTLPFILLLLDYWPLRRIPVVMKDRRNGILWPEFFPLMREKLPMLFLSGVSAIITVYAAQRGDAIKGLDAFPFIARLTNAIVSYVAYLEKMIWPQNLAAFYPHEGVVSFWKIVAACIVIGGVTALVLYTFPRYRYLFVGWFWYVGTLFPVIGLIQVGYHSMADRYAYIPLIGIFIIISWGFPEILSRLPIKKTRLILPAGMIVSFFALLTWQQMQHWRNSETLFQHALAVTKNNYQAHQGMGNVMLRRGNMDNAAGHYKEALRIKPDHADVLNNLGLVFMYQGKLEDAMQQYREALQIKPIKARTYNNMGVLFAMQGKTENAIAQFREALRIDPEYLSANKNLQLALLVQQNSEKQ